MARLSRLKITENLSEVLFWIEWINSERVMLSFRLPPRELLILFVVQSVDLSRLWNLTMSDPLPRVVVDGYIRAVLLDKLRSYQLALKLVLRDIRRSTSRATRIDPGRLLRICRRTVAQLIVEKTISIKDYAFHKRAKTAVLGALRRSGEKHRGHGQTGARRASGQRND